MDPEKRVKKPEPVRTQPIRNWETLFGPPGAPPPGAPPSGDPVSGGVEAGYRVIEEYLRQGQSVARTLWAPPQGSGMPPDNGHPQHMTALFQSFSEFAGLWLDLMAKTGPGGFASRGPTPVTRTAEPSSNGPGVPTPPAAPEADGQKPSVEMPSGLTLEIESKRRVEVSVDLRARSAGLSLKVQDLRAPEPDKPRLTGVSIEGPPAEERIHLCIRIPDDHPAGVYSGVILDGQTSIPRGTLCVRLGPA